MVARIIKIILAVLVVGALSFGIYKWVTLEPPEEIDIEKFDDERIINIQHRIQTDINSVDYAQFYLIQNKYKEISKDIAFYFKDKELSKYNTCMDMLNNAYYDKSIAYANYIFKDDKWKSENIGLIRSSYYQLHPLFPKSTELKKINNVLIQYNQLVKYNQRVISQCNKKPHTKASIWDESNTKQLIKDVPIVDGVIKNCPIYKKTRKNEICQKLNNAHLQFINELMILVKQTGSLEDCEHILYELEKYEEQALFTYNQPNGKVANKVSEIKNKIQELKYTLENN